MNGNMWVRQIHRWLSIAFTATVVANFVAMSLGKAPTWVVYSPLLPLFLLLFTGLYMFVLPYAARWRSVNSITNRSGRNDRHNEGDDDHKEEFSKRNGRRFCLSANRCEDQGTRRLARRDARSRPKSHQTG